MSDAALADHAIASSLASELGAFKIRQAAFEDRRSAGARRAVQLAKTVLVGLPDAPRLDLVIGQYVANEAPRVPESCIAVGIPGRATRHQPWTEGYGCKGLDCHAAGSALPIQGGDASDASDDSCRHVRCACLSLIPVTAVLLYAVNLTRSQWA